jgi:serine/threonine-protein kinase
MIGRTLSHFEITAKLGEGGMGEVYRATDSKLGREVAIKVLPQEFVADEERLARFEREAKVLATLSHSNIAGIFEVGEDGGSHFLAMELAEGETLAERIDRGPIPLDEALAIALQLAEALEAAHEKRIVHRDLKPANIKVTPEGQVKVLDFGLAKAVEPEPATKSPDLFAQSPTLTARMTGAGVLLGTAAYMSPEQAKGEEADRRADIWAFGACLFEALAGRRAFRGNDTTEMMAAVLTLEPEWDTLPELSPALRRLLRRCLAKDRRQRFHDIADVRLELEEIRDAPQAEPDELRDAGSSRWLLAAAAGGAGLALGALLMFVAGPRAGSVAERPPRLRSSHLALVAGEPLPNPGGQIAVSPDGNDVVFAAGRGGESRLYRRRLDRLEAVAIPGTERGVRPFFSPDGQWLAFVDDEELKKVSLAGGDVQVLCEAHVSYGGTWADDGWIYYTYDENSLARVRETGGAPELIPNLQTYTLEALPGGTLLVGTENRHGVDKSHAPIVARLADGSIKVVVEAGYAPKWSPTGHLLYVRGDELFAVPFDPQAVETRGEAKRVLSGLWTDSIWGNARYAVAADGTLVYMAGADYARTVPTWIGRDGSEEPLPLEPAVHNAFKLSGDGRHLAVQIGGPRDQIHTVDLARGTSSRLTHDGGNSFPVWSSDGSAVIFSSTRREPQSLFLRRADGGGEAVSLADRFSVPAAQVASSNAVGAGAEVGTLSLTPTAVAPDGRSVVAGSWGDPVNGGDIWLIPLTDEGEPRPLVADPGNDILGVISPDGRWLAYLSNRSGRYEVYVSPYPAADRSVQVSHGGGDDPRWSPVGGELFYRDVDSIWSVPYETGDDFVPSTPRLVLETDFHNTMGVSFDVSPDGTRFLVNKPSVSSFDNHPLVLVDGWGEELERLVPVD